MIVSGISGIDPILTNIADSWKEEFVKAFAKDIALRPNIKIGAISCYHVSPEFSSGFAQLVDDPQKNLADKVNERLSKAIIQKRNVKSVQNSNYRVNVDPSPATGTVYQTVTHQAVIEQKRRHPSQGITLTNQPRDVDNVEEEEDYDWLLDEEQDGSDDEDRILQDLRERRWQEMKAAAEKKACDIALGHGQVRTISQDQFLGECTSSSEFVLCHFFHKEFQRCLLMDHHLKILAPQHTECKMIRMDAEKAPFFVHKLQIRILPTLLLMRHGKVVDRLVGFDGLLENSKLHGTMSGLQGADHKNIDPDSWKTSALQKWLISRGLDYPESSVEQKEAETNEEKSAIRRSLKTYENDDY